MNPEVSIIIVNYNSGDFLLNCLRSINNYIKINYEVVVVDNQSTDNSIQMCSSFMNNELFKFVILEKNVGFAKGNNIGCSHASSNVFHFLNPDTEIESSLNEDYLIALSDMKSVFINNLINKDGSTENSKNRIPTLRNMMLSFVFPKKAKYWYIGASVIIPKDFFELIGKWNEEYFLYSEDIDLFYRINSFNMPIKKLNSKIFHYGGGCSKNVFNSIEKEVVGQRSYKKFFLSYNSKIEYFIVKVLFLFYVFIKQPKKAVVQFKAWRIVLKEN